MAPLKLTAEERKKAFREINEKSDKIIAYALAIYFLFGIGLAFVYDTYLIAIGVGGLCVLAYVLTKGLLPNHRLHPYVMSALLAIFSAQFIYQMHGLFEMHFFFFVGSSLLITFRNWRLILPLLLITLVHHASFAWLQYQGMKEIYFTQLDYMDLQAFLFHALLAGVIMGISAYWSYDLEQSTLREATKTFQLEKQILNVDNNISFANEISKGNLSVSYSLDEQDELGKSLLKMRENLKVSSAREQEEKFITFGITKIGDVIRQHSDDAALLADEFVKCLVKYTNLNQGGLFLLEEEGDSKFLSLSACYAYDRKKFMTKRVELGEGLVGQCFLEGEPVYMTVVPTDYAKITSGLGGATPSCIYIVPVKTQDETVGVIEVAAFDQLKEHEKQFILKAAENIASAVVSSRTTTRIKRLLADTQMQAEQMKAQEEEMRQNMEEMQATQEEMARKQMENENRVKAIDDSGIASIEFDMAGNILSANDSFLKLMEYPLHEIQGKHHRIFVDDEYANSIEYNKFWEDLSRGIPRPGEYERVTRSGKRIFIKGSYSIIRDPSGKAIKVLKLATDISEMYWQKELLSEKTAELNKVREEVKSVQQSTKTLLMESMNGLR